MSIPFFNKYMRGYQQNADIAWLIVHALNPYGYSHGLPSSEHYAPYHDLLVPKRWYSIEKQVCDAKIFGKILVKGTRRVQDSITRGQYHYKDGLFFGGQSPSWSSLIWEQITSKYCDGKQAVALLDIHSGQGAWGEGEIITYEAADSARFQQLHIWFGSELKSTHVGSSVASHLSGTLSSTIPHLAVPHTFSIGLEFGTVKPLKVLNVMRAENWLYHQTHVSPDVAALIKKEIRKVFFLEDISWQQLLLHRFEYVLDRYIKGFQSVVTEV